MNTTTRVPSPSDFTELASQTADGQLLGMVAAKDRLLALQTATPPVQPPVFQSTGFANIASAIAKIMSEIGVVEKAGKNKFHNYDYAKMEDILRKLTPLMGKNGLVVIPTEESRNLFDNDTVVSATYVFTIMHTSGELWPERPKWTGISRARDSKGGFDDKALNKCATSAQKYFLKALFQIPTGDEGEDSDEDHEDLRKQARTPVPSLSGATPPHEVPVKGETFPTWAQKYAGFVSRADTASDIAEWQHINSDALNKVKLGAAPTYEGILKATKRRIAEIEARDAGPATAQKTETSLPYPNPATEPDTFLKWAEGIMAAVTDPAQLETVYNEQIEYPANGLFPPDQELVLQAFRRHEKRLGID